MENEADADLLNRVLQNEPSISRVATEDVRQRLRSGDSSHLVNGLLLMYMQTGADSLLDLIGMVNERAFSPHLNKLSDFVLHYPHNVYKLVLNSVHRVWFPALLKGSFLDDVIRFIIRPDTKTVDLVGGVLFLCSMLCHRIAFDSARFGLLFKVFLLVVGKFIQLKTTGHFSATPTPVSTTDRKSSMDRLMLKHLHIVMHLFFQRLYCLLPNLFLAALRGLRTGAPDQNYAQIYDCIRPFFRTVRLHPDLVEGLLERELGDARIHRKDSSAFLIQCMSHTIDRPCMSATLAASSRYSWVPDAPLLNEPLSVLEQSVADDVMPGPSSNTSSRSGLLLSIGGSQATFSRSDSLSTSVNLTPKLEGNHSRASVSSNTSRNAMATTSGDIFNFNNVGDFPESKSGVRFASNSVSTPTTPHKRTVSSEEGLPIGEEAAIALPNHNFKPEDLMLDARKRNPSSGLVMGAARKMTFDLRDESRPLRDDGVRSFVNEIGQLTGPGFKMPKPAILVPDTDKFICDLNMKRFQSECEGSYEREEVDESDDCFCVARNRCQSCPNDLEKRSSARVRFVSVTKSIEEKDDPEMLVENYKKYYATLRAQYPYLDFFQLIYDEFGGSSLPSEGSRPASVASTATFESSWGSITDNNQTTINFDWSHFSDAEISKNRIILNEHHLLYERNRCAVLNEIIRQGFGTRAALERKLRSYAVVDQSLAKLHLEHEKLAKVLSQMRLEKRAIEQLKDREIVELKGKLQWYKSDNEAVTVDNQRLYDENLDMARRCNAATERLSACTQLLNDAQVELVELRSKAELLKEAETKLKTVNRKLFASQQTIYELAVSTTSSLSSTELVTGRDQWLVDVAQKEIHKLNKHLEVERRHERANAAKVVDLESKLHKKSEQLTELRKDLENTRQNHKQKILALDNKYKSMKQELLNCFDIIAQFKIEHRESNFLAAHKMGSSNAPEASEPIILHIEQQDKLKRYQSLPLPTIVPAHHLSK